jgi:hypothetical protein
MRIAKDLIPRSARHRLRRILRPAFLGIARRTTPLSRHWGFDRGTPVDRYYIERFPSCTPSIFAATYWK